MSPFQGLASVFKVCCEGNLKFNQGAVAFSMAYFCDGLHPSLVYGALSGLLEYHFEYRTLAYFFREEQNRNHIFPHELAVYVKAIC